jgi:hypothetical protein
MKISIVHFGKILSRISLAVVIAVAVSSCGGGDGDDAASRNVIAPESLSDVEINFFEAFSIKCYRLSGTAGNEFGAGDYDKLKDTFRYADPDGLGYTIALPLSLTNVQYRYERTGVDTGRVTFEFVNLQAYPHQEANKDNKLVEGVGDMFWGGRGRTATTMVVDILFVEQGNLLANGSARIQHLYLYESNWTEPGPANNFTDPLQFDTTEITFKKFDGNYVPAGYNPYTILTDREPSSVVMTTLDFKDFDFSGSFIGVVAFRKTGDLGPEIPGGVRPEESGTILITEMPSQTVGYKGTYSYGRTGGAFASLAVEYQKIEGGSSSEVKESFVLEFTSLDGGNYVSSSGGVGIFQNNLDSP